MYYFNVYKFILLIRCVQIYICILLAFVKLMCRFLFVFVWRHCNGRRKHLLKYNITNIRCDCGQYTRTFSLGTLNCMDVLYYSTPLASGNITHPCNSRYLCRLFDWFKPEIVTGQYNSRAGISNVIFPGGRAKWS
jgi:hypothetical protein